MNSLSIFGCAGSLLWSTGCSLRWHLLSWSAGLAAPELVGSSRTRDQTRVPSIGGQILNHWIPREVQGLSHFTAENFHCFRQNCKVSLYSSVSLTEKVWHVSTWWLWPGLGTILDLDSGQIPHPRCVLVPSVCPALQAVTGAPLRPPTPRALRKSTIHGRNRLPLKNKKTKSSPRLFFYFTGVCPFLFSLFYSCYHRKRFRTF